MALSKKDRQAKELMNEMVDMLGRLNGKLVAFRSSAALNQPFIEDFEARVEALYPSAVPEVEEEYDPMANPT